MLKSFKSFGPALAMFSLMACLFGSVMVDGAIRVIETSTVWDSNGGGVSIRRPSGTQPGDLLVMVVHRTDYYLPYEIEGGWTRLASCYKTNNNYDCAEVSDCIGDTFREEGSKYCTKFRHGKRKGAGHDLAQTIFFKKVPCDGSMPSSYEVQIKKKGGKPAWIIMAAIRGADTENPIRDWASEGDDGSPDSKFPRVKGKKGDLALLSMSYDDKIGKEYFRPPTSPSFTYAAYIAKSDESGFLYKRVLKSNDETDHTMRTRGRGGYSDKDALISLTIKPSDAEACPSSKRDTKIARIYAENHKCDLKDVKMNVYCDIKNGGCGRALAFVKKHGGSCKEYCESQGLQCVGAWEDYGNRCTTPKGEFECDEDITKRFETSDALCECDF